MPLEKFKNVCYTADFQNCTTGNQIIERAEFLQFRENNTAFPCETWFKDVYSIL
jgi:hypothetical protein